MITKKEKPKALLKALTVANIINQRVTRILFTDKWFQAFKQPQDRGVWFVWGGTGSGKSSFIMQLAKAIALLGFKVFYNSLEEETDDDEFIERVDINDMNDVSEHFTARTFEYKDCIAFLQKRDSAKVVIIDSATYFFENFEQYQEFKKLFKNKIIIITGHARGNNPKTELEDRIKFDAKMKIFVNAYLALCKGRTIGPNGERYIIWQTGYELANGSKDNN